VNKNSGNENTFREAMNLDLDFVRAEVNAGLDRWFYWALRLRDLVNASGNYTCDAFDNSARRIKTELRHCLLNSLSKVHRFECLRERLEGISNTGGNGSESPETQQ